MHTSGTGGALVKYDPAFGWSRDLSGPVTPGVVLTNHYAYTRVGSRLFVAWGVYHRNATIHSLDLALPAPKTWRQVANFYPSIQKADQGYARFEVAGLASDSTYMCR
eukprot:tig00001178_g7391.t1